MGLSACISEVSWSLLLRTMYIVSIALCYALAIAVVKAGGYVQTSHKEMTTMPKVTTVYSSHSCITQLPSVTMHSRPSFVGGGKVLFGVMDFSRTGIELTISK